MNNIIKGIQNLKKKIRKLTMRVDSLEKICSKMYYPAFSYGVFQSVVSMQLTEICTRLDTLEESMTNTDIERKVRRIDVEVSHNRTMHAIRGEQIEKLESRIQALEEITNKQLMPTQEEINALFAFYGARMDEKPQRVDLLDKENFMPSMDELKGVFGNE